MKRVQASGAANRRLKKHKEEKINNDIKKTKCISSFFKSDLLQSENKVSDTSETIINPTSINDTSTEKLTNINDTSAEEIESLNAEIFTTDSQICESVSVVVNEENSNYVDCDYSQIQDSSETETTLNSPIEMMTDIGLWPENMSKYVDYWINKGIIHLQNCNEELIKKKSLVQKNSTGKWTRKCNTGMFKRKCKNGDLIDRSWLCFSPSKGRLFCSVCKLMSSTSSQTQFNTEGFFNWKNSNERLLEHETSKTHLNAFIALKDRSVILGRIDAELQKQMDQEKFYWKKVLTRLVSVIKFLSKRGLAFRGDNELIGSQSNGNYLGLLELIAEYDEFLKKHIQETGNCGNGNTNYLSSTICEELIKCMGHQVFNTIISRIKKSKYYSISIDSTPDEGHVDQLTIIFRFMEGPNPVERFLNFLPNQGHKAQEIFDGIMKFFVECNLDIKNCRGQSYDNASTMSGKYNGLQSKIIAENSLATWVPCAAHSLNLVGKAAAECCYFAISFFNFLEEIYVFFTSSTHRYNVLTENLKSNEKKSNVLVPKRISTTRWSCRTDATKALVQGYPQIKSTLLSFSEDFNELPKTRHESNGLYKKMCQLETGIYCIFWHEILDRFNATNKTLQAPTLDLNNVVACIKSLKTFIDAQRELFLVYEEKGKDISDSIDYTVRKRNFKNNVRLQPLGYKNSSGVELNPSEKFKIDCFLPVIDQLSTSINQRLKAYEVICNRFGFFGRLYELSYKELQEAAKQLVTVYKDDLDELLCVEIVHFAEFMKLYSKSKPTQMSNEHFMYQTLIEKDVQTAFPNVEVALRIYLVIMVTNCSGERSFSRLKIIQNRLRTSMHEERLNFLSIMSLENDVLDFLSFDEIIKDFAEKKTRKVSNI